MVHYYSKYYLFRVTKHYRCSEVDNEIDHCRIIKTKFRRDYLGYGLDLHYTFDILEVDV